MNNFAVKFVLFKKETLTIYTYYRRQYQALIFDIVNIIRNYIFLKNIKSTDIKRVTTFFYVKMIQTT